MTGPEEITYNVEFVHAKKKEDSCDAEKVSRCCRFLMAKAVELVKANQEDDLTQTNQGGDSPKAVVEANCNGPIEQLGCQAEFKVKLYGSGVDISDVDAIEADPLVEVATTARDVLAGNL